MPYTPICIAKAVKNSTESEGMRRAHVSRAADPGNRMGGWSEGFCSILICVAPDLAQVQNLSGPLSFRSSRVSGRME